MAFWTYNGLKFGIKSVKFPKERDFYEGFASSVEFDADKCKDVILIAQGGDKKTSLCGNKCGQICPMKAIDLKRVEKDVIDLSRCIFCGLCVDVCKDIVGAFNYTDRLELVPDINAKYDAESGTVKRKIFKKSLFVKHIDTGSCGACESEINALNHPYYNMHRLGIFITPSPRFADALIVTGVFTGKMGGILENVLENTPRPRYIVLVGACALFGGIFENSGKNFEESGDIFGNGFAGLRNNETGGKIGFDNHGIASILKNEYVIGIPHCPPNPFEILNALIFIKNGGFKQ